MNSGKVRAVIYPRVSEAKSLAPDRDESDSIATQVQALTALADREGYELVRDAHFYADDGKSGFSGVPRPGFSKLLADLARDVFDLVLVRHDDRLARNDEESGLWRAACARYGIRWQTLGGAITDPGTAQGGLTAAVTAAIGAYESQVKRERLLLHYADRRARGELLPSSRTFGWEADRRTADEAEARWVRYAFEHVAGGGTVGAVVARLNAEGVPQVRGGDRWQHGTLVAILKNPRYAGLVPDEHGVPIPGLVGRWDALITPEVFEAVQVARKARRPVSGPRNRYSTVHLLGGIATCGVCGFTLRSNGNADDRSGLGPTGTYRCDRNRWQTLQGGQHDGQRHVSARANDLDELARREVVLAFTFGTADLLPRDADDVRQELDRVHAALAGIAETRSEVVGMIDPALGITRATVAPRLAALVEQETALLAERDSLRERSAAASVLVDLRRDALGPGRVHPDDLTALRQELRARLDALDIEAQRDLVRHLLEVVVHPGRTAGKYEIRHRVAMSLNEPETAEDVNAA